MLRILQAGVRRQVEPHEVQPRRLRERPRAVADTHALEYSARAEHGGEANRPQVLDLLAFFCTTSTKYKY
jgi:hypothetical protein